MSSKSITHEKEYGKETLLGARQSYANAKRKIQFIDVSPFFSDEGSEIMSHIDLTKETERDVSIGKR